LFEKQLAGKGFGLREVATLAATIEHLVHNEAVSKLGTAFNVVEQSLTSTLSSEEVTEVLDTYMMSYVLGQSLSNNANLTKQLARRLIKAMPKIHLGWNDTQKYVDGIRQNIITDEAEGANFASVAKIIQTVGEEYGTFQDKECQQMMDTLMTMEYRGTGRVMLSDFYKPALEGAWTFKENYVYLKSMGALDDSDSTRPSVMIANYIQSPSNCIAGSGFYSVCCKNECEGLLGHLEEKIGTSEARPATIVNLISNLASRSAAAPQLSASLLQRLDEIAATHLGTVPLHGRLFAQWMHHVYPRECPYPHLTGTTDGMMPEDWKKEHGHDGSATDEEMQAHVDRAAKETDVQVQGDLAVEDLMPWSHEEELIVVRPVITEQSLRSGGSMWAMLRGVAFLTASGSFAYGMIRTLPKISQLGSGAPLGNEKFMV